MALLQEDICIKCRYGIIYMSTCMVHPGISEYGYATVEAVL